MGFSLRCSRKLVLRFYHLKPSTGPVHVHVVHNFESYWCLKSDCILFFFFFGGGGGQMVRNFWYHLPQILCWLKKKYNNFQLQVNYTRIQFTLLSTVHCTTYMITNKLFYYCASNYITGARQNIGAVVSACLGQTFNFWSFDIISDWQSDCN